MKYDIWINNRVIETVEAANWAAALNYACAKYGNAWVTETK